MIRQITLVGAAALAMSAGANARGVPDGSAHGAHVGEHNAGAAIVEIVDLMGSGMFPEM